MGKKLKWNLDGILLLYCSDVSFVFVDLCPLLIMRNAFENRSQPCETWVQTSNRCSRMKFPVDRYGIAKEALRNACKASERMVRQPCADGARASNENDS